MMAIEKVEVPGEFEAYVSSKVEKNGSGGRPHFLQELAKNGDAIEQAFNVIELAWIKNRSIGSVARKFGTTYSTIYRFLKDLEPYKEALIAYLEMVPRRKQWYSREADSSDYDSVQAYIRRARRTGLRNYKYMIRSAAKCWRFLKYKDPERWTAENVIDYLNSLSEGAQSGSLDAIRQIAPQIGDRNSTEYVGTGRFREKLSRRKKDIFGKEVKMVLEPLVSYGLKFHEVIFKTHVTLGAREGSKDSKSGITGLSWDRLKDNFTRIDLYERKVRGGIWWRDCPLTLFFKELPEQLKELWIKRGKPITDKLILDGYPEIIQVYKEIRKAISQYYQGKIDPGLFKELSSLKPHDADKIHVNLLWEAEIPLEVVAGQYLGRGEGIGLMGRGWLDINTIKKHYLSLTQRSERFQKLRRQVEDYSKRFD